MNLRSMGAGLERLLWRAAAMLPRDMLGQGKRVWRATQGARVVVSGDTVEVLYRGVAICGSTSLLTERIQEALRDGVYELPEANAIAEVVRPGDVVFDIGSGLGFISTLAARAAPGVKVYAFEANPALCAVARETHRVNKVEVTQLNEVLLDRDGVAPFHIHHDFWASSTIHWVGAEVIEVATSDFARRVAELQPTVLIVDIEGGERELFGRADLGGVRAIIVEVHPHILGQEACDAVVAGIVALGFTRKSELEGSGVFVLQRPA